MVFLFSFAQGQELYLGPKTELKFDSKKIESLPFEPCEGDSSCAYVEKTIHEYYPTSEKIRCTFLVKGENVSALKIEGSRILTVQKVLQSNSSEVTTLILDGAKSPIHLTCQKGV